MALARHPQGTQNDPFNMFEDLNQTLGRFFGRESNGGSLGRALSGWAPKTDIYESNGKQIVELEAAGLDCESFYVSLEGNVLTVEGQKVDESEQKGRNYMRQERMQGSFQRSFRLPEEVDPDEIHAEYDNGVLRLELPIGEPSEKKKIAIE